MFTGSYKDENFFLNKKINLNNIYKELYASSFFQERIDNLRKFFLNKYNLSSFSLSVLDINTDKMIVTYHTNEWGEFNIDSFKKGLKLNVFYHPLLQYYKNILLNITPITHPMEIKIMDGMVLQNDNPICQLAVDLKEFSSLALVSTEILGKKLKSYIAFLTSRKDNNIRMFFSFSFKNITLNEIDYYTYLNLMSDFQKFSDTLNVFLSYFDIHGHIDDSILMKEMIKNDEFYNINYYN
jgi:hypothetical protein